MKTDNNTSHKKNNKIWFALITLILAAVTTVLAVRETAEYRERLAEYGLNDAITGSPLVITLAGFTLIFSVLYLISDVRIKRLKRKRLIRLAKQAEEAKAKGEEFVMPTRTAGDKVGSALSKVLDIVTKAIILLLVFGIIGAGIYTKTGADEFNQRPVYNVMDAVDISGCVTGYDGLAYIDPESVVYNLPEDVTEIIKTGGNYKETQDYSEQQKIWNQFLNDLKYEITPDTSQGGTLANGDVVTVTSSLEGYTIPKLQASLGIMFEGIGESKEHTIAGLPYKYNDAETVMAEKSDLIKAAYDKLKKESYKKYKSFKSAALTGFTFDKAYLVKPIDGADVNPDALLLVAYTGAYPDTEYPSTHTMTITVFPFSSETTAEDITAESGESGNIPAPGQVSSDVKFFEYNPVEKVLASFETGIYFSATTGYTLTELPWTEPVAE